MIKIKCKKFFLWNFFLLIWLNFNPRGDREKKRNTIHTVHVYAHFARGNVRGHAKVRYPQVLDLTIAKHVPCRFVEGVSGKHGRHRIRQVHDLLTIRCHFLQANRFNQKFNNKRALISEIYLWPFGGSIVEPLVVVLLGPQSAHERSDASAADHVYGNVGLEHRLDHTNVSGTSRSATAQHEADRRAGEESGQARKVRVLVHRFFQQILLIRFYL